MKNLFKKIIVVLLILFCFASIGLNSSNKNYYDNTYWSASIIGTWTGSAWQAGAYGPTWDYLLYLTPINSWEVGFRPDSIRYEHTAGSQIDIKIYDNLDNLIGSSDDYQGDDVAITFGGAGTDYDIKGVVIGSDSVSFQVTGLNFYAGGAQAAQLIKMPLKGNLNDLKSGLTAGQLSRISAASYVKAGVLKYAVGDRDQLIDTSAQNDVTTWWGKTNAANSVYNGIVADETNGAHRISKGSLLTNGSSYVLSAELKAGAVEWSRFLVWSAGSVDNHALSLNLADGELGLDFNTLSKGIESLDDGWYRCWLSFTAIADPTVYIDAATAEGGLTFAGDDSTVSIYIRNVMLEELPSGDALGSELIGNPDFSSYSGSDPTVDFTTWIEQESSGAADFNYNSGGEITVTSAPSSAAHIRFAQTVSTVAGKWYYYTITANGGASNSADMRFLLQSRPSFTTILNLTLTADGADQNKTGYVFIPAADTEGCDVLAQFSAVATAGDIAVWKNISLKQIPDSAYLRPSVFVNSATIPAEARFETEGLLIEPAAVNLVSYSEDFSQWTKQSNVVLTAEDMTGPDGLESGTKYSLLAASNRYIQADIGGNSSGRTMTGSIWFYCTSATTLTVQFLRDATTDGNYTSQAIAANPKWARYSWTHTYSANASSTFSFRIYDDSGGTGDRFHIFGAQLEESAFPTSYIPTDGAATVRTSEAADGTYGFRWTMSQAVKNALGASSPSIGTLILDYNPLHDSNTTARGLVAVTSGGPAGFLYHGAANGRFASTDGTNYPVYDRAYTNGDSLRIFVRFNETLSDFRITVRDDGTFYHGTLNDYDGAFSLGSYLWLAWSNIYPFHVKDFYLIDSYLSDADIEAEIWRDKGRGIFKTGTQLK